MSFGKRQLILGALVVALGTAVYLNWQFSGTGDLSAADASVEEKELGKAQLVNGTILEEDDISDDALYTEEHSTDIQENIPSSESETEIRKKDTPADSVSTSAEITKPEETTAEDYFTQAGLNRQKTRDQAIEALQEILGKEDVEPDQIEQAVEESSAIAKNMLRESNIENLVKSKGYSDCVAFIQNDECSLVVGKPGEFTKEDAAVIKDIVVGQSEITPDHIKIVDHNTEKS